MRIRMGIIMIAWPLLWLAGACGGTASQQATADFASVMAAPERSQSVVMVGEQERAPLMKRVLVSPNLLFEPSRSSVGEPPTQGPQGAEPPAPELGDAVGLPVDIALSSLVLEYLTRQGSVVIAPAVTHRWERGRWCDDVERMCRHSTWLERLLAEARDRSEAKLDAPAAQEDGGEPADEPEEREEARDESGEREELADEPGERGEAGAGPDARAPGEFAETQPEAPLPTAALAVRELGLAFQEIEVVVERQGERDPFVIRPRAYAPDESSYCPGDSLASLPVPALVFSAELLDPTDGRVIARIHEVERLPASVVEFEVPVYWSSFVNEPPEAEQCEAVRAEYIDRVAEPLRAAVRADAAPYFGPLIARGLEGLFP